MRNRLAYPKHPIQANQKSLLVDVKTGKEQGGRKGVDYRESHVAR